MCIDSSKRLLDQDTPLLVTGGFLSGSKNRSIIKTMKVPIRILHVDDDLTFLNITRDILNIMGDFVIEHALCAEEALNKLKTEDFDIVISDYDMPNKNGLDFLRELREQKNMIPFVLFTGKGREDIAMTALNLGADGYYNKQGKTETVYGELTHGILLVSTRLKAKIALEESEKRYRTIMEQAADVILIHDKEGKIIDANQAAYRKSGYTRAELLSMSIMDISPEATKKQLENLWPKIVAGQNITLEAIHIYKNGNLIPVEVTLGPLTIENEIFLIGIVRDISERRKTEQSIRQSEENYRLLFESILDGIVISDSRGVVVSVNNAAVTMFGYESREELVNVPASLLYEDPKDRVILFEQLIKKGSLKDYEIKLKRKDGKSFDAIVSVVLQRDLLNDILRTEVIIRDITKRKKDKDITEIKLTEMDMQFAANLFEAASDSILVHDLAGNIVVFNQAAHKLRGYSREEFEALTVSDLEAPGNVWDFKARMTVLLDNGEGVFETYNLCKDKSVLPFEIHARSIELIGRKLVLSVARDISDRKKAELKLAESNKRIELMNEKLYISGSLTRHDVRNKLSTVTDYAYLLKKKHPNEADIIDSLGKIEQAISDSMRIFDFANVYEQMGAEELVYVDVEKTVNEALALFSDFNLKVINECQGLTLLADSFLRQLFYNLLDNTLKYGQKATTVRVFFERAGSDILKLIYEDDGVGIPKENKEQLFKQGFSTGGSTGFGLFLIKKMVEIYGWTIQETGEPSKGTQFTITIIKQENNTKCT